MYISFFSDHALYIYIYPSICICVHITYKMRGHDRLRKLHRAQLKQPAQKAQYWHVRHFDMAQDCYCSFCNEMMLHFSSYLPGIMAEGQKDF